MSPWSNRAPPKFFPYLHDNNPLCFCCCTFRQQTATPVQFCYFYTLRAWFSLLFPPPRPPPVAIDASFVLGPVPHASLHPPPVATMAERYIPEHRRTQFKAKNTFKPDELRRRREEQQVEIRKAKREENLAKRRGIGTGDQRPGASLGAAPDSDDENPPTESQVSLPLFPFLAAIAISTPRRRRFGSSIP